MSFRVAVLCASLGSLVASFAACGGEDSANGASSPITFHAEKEPLGDFAFDTGLIPAGSPAQVSLKLSAGGKLRVDAVGESAKDGIGGRSASGKLALDVHFKMDGRLKIDSKLKQLDDDLPGLKDIDVPIVGEATFDPFLLDDGESAKVDVAVPETKLPDIPLGSTPGKLQLTVTGVSKLTSSFQGGCMSVANEQATYSGVAKTSGTLVLKGTLVVDLPAPLNKAVDLGEITIPVPAVETPLEFETQAARGAADGDKGPTCPSGGAGVDGGADEGDSASSGKEGSAPSPYTGYITIGKLSPDQSYVTAVFYPATEESKNAAGCTATKIGDCTVSECSSNDSSDSTMKYVSAGVLTIEGGLLPAGGVSISPNDDNFAYLRSLPFAMFESGNALDVSAAGGGVPAFSAKQVYAPSEVHVTSPSLGGETPMTLDPSRNLNVAWTGAGAGYVYLQLSTLNVTTSRTTAIYCTATASAGQVSVPKAALAMLERTDNENVFGSISVTPSVVTRFKAGEYDVFLSADGIGTTSSFDTK